MPRRVCRKRRRQDGLVDSGGYISGFVKSGRTSLVGVLFGTESKNDKSDDKIG
jgi:hypothetical protein